MVNKLIKTYNDTVDKIKNHPKLKELNSWSKKYSPRGFRGVSIYDVYHFIMQEFKKDNLTTRANSIAFSLFLSLFPAIIFLFTLLPLIPIVQDYMLTLKLELSRIIPKNANDYLFGIIEDITSIKRDGLLSIGFLLALFFSSNGMLTLMSGFDKTYSDTFKPRNLIRKRIIAIALTIILTILLIMSLAMLVAESKIFGYLRAQYAMPEALLLLFTLVKWTVAIALVYTGITIIYAYGPSMYRKVRFINVGSVIATFLSLLTSLGFSFFINNFGRYNEIYGSIGALIVAMIWIQLNSFILLVGFELNASIAINRDINYKRSKNVL